MSPWFFGTLILLIAVDQVDSFLKSYEWGMNPHILAQNAVFLVFYGAGIMSERRWVQLVVVVVASLAQLAWVFQGIGVLGSW